MLGTIRWIVAALLLLGTVIGFSPAQAASGVLTNCTYAALSAQLVGGGTIVFACSGVIELPPLGAIVINSDTTLDATGQAVTLRGSPDVALLIVEPGAALRLINLTITTTFAGTAIINDGGSLTLDNTTVTDNSAGILPAGGIINFGGSVTLNHSTLRNNQGSSGEAGAIFNAGTLSINGSTFYGNNSFGLTAAGGAVLNAGGTASITNSTFIANVIAGGQMGGGGALFNDSGTLTITNSTFFGNSVDEDPFSGSGGSGGAIYAAGGTVSARNTLIAGTRNGGACVGPLSATNSLADDATCAGMRQVSTAALNMGAETGSPVYLPLLAGSAAIDAGDNGVCPATDQRGVSRPQGAACDVGAYEFESAVVAPAPSFPAPPPVPLCADLTGATNPIVRADVPGGTVPNGGVFCRVLVENGSFVTTQAEIGDPAVLNQTILQAVDVFGMAGGLSVPRFNNTIRVCLSGSGRFLYLDATTAPRTLSQLPAVSENGYACAVLPNAGTVVLVQ